MLYNSVVEYLRSGRSKSYAYVYMGGIVRVLLDQRANNPGWQREATE